MMPKKVTKRASKIRDIFVWVKVTLVDIVSLPGNWNLYQNAYHIAVRRDSLHIKEINAKCMGQVKKIH